MSHTVRNIFAAIATMAIVLTSLFVGVNKSHALVVDLNYNAIAFDNNSDIGANDPNVGFSYRYSNAATAGSQSIDAIVTITDKTNVTISQVDQGSPSQSAPTENLNTRVDFGSGGGSLTYRIDFVESGTNTPIILQNVAIATWDIDIQQFAQFAGITSYKLDANTVLQTLTNTGGIAAGSYRFYDSTNTTSDATDQPNWVEVRYAQVNTLQIVLGAEVSGGAFYSTKFAPEVWTNAVTTTPSATAYTITYDGNTNTSGTAPASTTGTGGQTVSGNTGSLDKTGYYLAGWNTAADGSGATYLPGSTIYPVANTTLYAVWVSGAQPTYTLTYDGNTSDGGTAPASLTGYGTYAVYSNTGTLSKTGYTFAGWNTAANGTGTSYQAGDSLNLTSNVTLYAQWTVSAGASQPTNYTLTYDPNQSTTGTAPSPTSSSSTATTAPNSGNLSMPGYTFAGWNTQADGSGTTYQPGDAISLTGNITLYAMWVPVLAETSLGGIVPLLAPAGASLIGLGIIMAYGQVRAQRRRSSYIAKF